MHLPGPFRAAVGLVATAAAEVRQLPDRAIELPMLAVSSALQASLRTQQRYARLAARGDDVLNRRRPTSDAPPWATFDEPVPVEDLRRAALAELTRLEPWIADLGVGDASDAPEPTPEPTPARAPAAPAPRSTAPAKKTTAKRTAAKKTSAEKTSAERTAAKRTAVKKTSAEKKAAPKVTANTKAARKTTAPAAKAAPTAATAPAKDPVSAEATSPTSETSDPSSRLEGKTVSKPRHTAPSRFDDAGD